ncbi:MAG: RHS repeat-associated core domain-containing protein [Phycisphaerales bacterium]|nr:RHS repeat-associated core domain-containing protein [Phycisphaerales bacterium]
MAYAYLYNANGDVGQVVDPNAASAAASLVARYEYDPYGGVIFESGSYAASNAWRFSTKQFDPVTGLGCWGYRWYSPRLGRWVSRDPIEERGGQPLYCYVSGSPVTMIDALGLMPHPLDTLPCDCFCCKCGEEVSAALIVGPKAALECYGAAKAADTVARATYLGGQGNNMADAFRHCYGQCLATLRVGASKAQKCGDIHEFCGRAYAANTPGAEAMDQHNNALGRSFGSRPGATAGTCYDDCKSAVDAAGPASCPPAAPASAKQAQTCVDPTRTARPPNPVFDGWCDGGMPASVR